MNTNPEGTEHGGRADFFTEENEENEDGQWPTADESNHSCSRQVAWGKLLGTFASGFLIGFLNSSGLGAEHAHPPRYFVAVLDQATSFDCRWQPTDFAPGQPNSCSGVERSAQKRGDTGSTVVL